MRIRSHLVLLALGLIVPVLALVLVSAALLVKEEQQLFAQAAVERVRATMNAMDAQVEGHAGTLVAVTALRALAERDFRRFQSQMARVLATQPEWFDLILATRDGDTLASASLPYTEAPALPRMLDPRVLERVVRTRKPAVGGMATVPAIARAGLTLAVPVESDGALQYVLAAVLKPESFLGLLQAQRMDEGWVSGLVDADGRFIARVPPPNSASASEGFRAAAARTGEGWYRGTTVEGHDSYTAHITSQLTGWSLGLGIPADTVQAEAKKMAWLMGIGIAGAIALALVLAAWLGRRISEPVMAIAAVARRIGRGEAASTPKWEQVSELREVGAALQEAAASVRDRQSLLEREKRALEEADRAKDAFIAMVSHELRNPLAAVVSAGDLLDAADADSSAARHACAVIRRQTRHMARLIDDLLDISRLTVGKAHLQFEVLNLAEAAATVIDTWRAGGRFREERVGLEALPVWIYADRARVEQILSNLLDNALKFSPADTAVTVKVARVEDDAVLEVSDRGRGLPRELIEDAFALFVQGDQGLARQKGGMGVGLALVKRLAELQHGTVSASSEEGMGSVFTVRFPAVAPRPVDDAAPARPAPASARRVLLIDDNEDFRSMMAESMAAAGHQVFQAADAEAGLALAMEEAPEVALVDIGLPGMNGYDVARLLRAQRGEAIVLIALSGYGQPADRQRAFAAGFDEHLTKPATPERIAEAIRASSRERERRVS